MTSSEMKESFRDAISNVVKRWRPRRKSTYPNWELMANSEMKVQRCNSSYLASPCDMNSGRMYLPDEQFVAMWAIEITGVEERHPIVVRVVNDCNRICLRRRILK
jgi:hypothetical protein